MFLLMPKKSKLWFDVTNSSHVHFFRPLVEELQGKNDIVMTCRELAETRALLECLNIDYKNFGRHSGNNKCLKVVGHLLRCCSMLPHLNSIDFAFSHGSPAPIMIKYIKGAKLISSYDNEHAMSFELLSNYSDYVMVPEVLEEVTSKRAGDKTDVTTYPGVKEQIYLADFKPDERVKKSIPFDDYVVLRAEAWKSDYVENNHVKAYDIAKGLISEGYNIVFLPRYGFAPGWMERSEQVFIPPPMNGPQLCWYSKGVLTGSGTLAREAAVLGVPSVSFYSSTPLKVDLLLESKGSVFRSGDTDAIIEYLDNSGRKRGLLKDAWKVRRCVTERVKEIIS